MAEYNPCQNNLQDYIIDNNKKLIEQNNALIPKIKLLEKDLEKEIDDHDTTSKKIVYLRGLLINEYIMRKQIYQVFLEMKEDRQKIINRFNHYAFFKNLLFIIVLGSGPIAWSTFFFMNKDVFSTYLTINSICCIIYFIFLPEFVFENKLSKRLDSLLSEYKAHVKNTSYLEELLNSIG